MNQSSKTGLYTKPSTKKASEKASTAFRLKQARSQSISKKGQQFMLSRYPELYKDLPARRLFIWSARAHYMVDEETNEPRMGCRLLVSFMGVRQKDANTGKFIRHYKKAYVPGFGWTERWRQGKLERTMKSNGLEELCYKILTTNYRLEERVYVDTGLKVTERIIQEHMRELKKESANLVWRHHLQKLIGDYMNNVAPHHYTTARDKYYDETIDIVLLELKRAERELRKARTEQERKRATKKVRSAKLQLRLFKWHCPLVLPLVAISPFVPAAQTSLTMGEDHKARTLL